MKHYEATRQENRDEVEELIFFSPMALLLTIGDELISGVFNPVYRNGKFILHLNRTDEQFKALQAGASARLIFFDHLANIPSYWVDENYGGAATSYYRFADFDCTIETYLDAGAVAKISQEFLDRFQPEGGYAALSPDSEIYKSSFKILGIVELTPKRTTAKWKLGQNRPVATRTEIARKLRERNAGNDARAAEEVEKWIRRRENP